MSMFWLRRRGGEHVLLIRINTVDILELQRRFNSLQIINPEYDLQGVRSGDYSLARIRPCSAYGQVQAVVRSSDVCQCWTCVNRNEEGNIWSRYSRFSAPRTRPQCKHDFAIKLLSARRMEVLGVFLRLLLAARKTSTLRKEALVWFMATCIGCSRTLNHEPASPAILCGILCLAGYLTTGCCLRIHLLIVPLEVIEQESEIQIEWKGYANFCPMDKI